MFDLEKFRTGDYFVHLPSKELYDDVMQFLIDNGIIPQNRMGGWYLYRNRTCIRYTSFDTEDKNIWYASEDYYLRRGLKKLNITMWGLSPLVKNVKEGTELEKEAVLNQSDNMVKSPNHYIGKLGLEVEEVLRNFIPRYEDGYVAHRIASAIEYLLRSPLKNGKQDLEKAGYNIQQALEHISKRGDQHT